VGQWAGFYCNVIEPQKPGNVVTFLLAQYLILNES